MRAMPFAAAGALVPTREREKKDREECIENQEEPWDHLSSSTAWQKAGQFLMTTFEGGDVPRMSAILRIGQERKGEVKYTEHKRVSLTFEGLYIDDMRTSWTSTTTCIRTSDIDVVHAGVAPLSEISVGETLSETGTLLPTSSVAPEMSGTPMPKIPRCTSAKRRKEQQSKNRFGNKFSANPYYITDASRFRQFQSWKGVLEEEEDDDKIFTVQTTQSGYFRGRPFRFRCECKIERDQWVGSLVQVLFERANQAMPPIRYSAFQRLRRTVHTYYATSQTQMVVAGLILLNFFLSIAQAQTSLDSTAPKDSAEPTPGADLESLFETLDLVFTAIFALGKE